jgi:alanyl-tRNA synthetase
VIGMVKLLSEASIGSGVRRVEALVGLDAFRYLAREHVLVQQLAGDLKAPPEQLPERIAATLDRLRSAEKELERLRAAAVLASAGTLAEGAEMLGATRVVTAGAPSGVGAGELRSLALDVRGRLPQSEAAVVVLAAPGEKGVSFVAAVNDAGQSAGLSANDVVRAFAPALGARGGGKADLAQGAGGDPAKLADAFAAVRRYVAERGTG